MCSSDIYFDEAGNTGQDLLNKDQPAFVLASNNFNPVEARELASLFKQDNELHFKKLKNSENGRRSIIKFLNHDLISEKNIICYISNKQYVAIAQIVDQLIETFYYEHNIDIYVYGYNIILTNSLYYLGNFNWEKPLFDEMLSSFVSMIRNKTEESIEIFYRTVGFLHQSIKDADEKTLIKPILGSKRFIGEILEAVEIYTLDVTLSTFLVICDDWFEKLNRRIDVFSDDSKQLNFYKEYIDFMKTHDEPAQKIGYGSRTRTFPSQINSVNLVTSNNHLSVQLSDLIASSLAFIYNNTNIKHEKFVTEIKNSKLLSLENFRVLMPQPKFTPKDLDMEDASGVSSVDFIAWEAKKRNGFKPI